MSHISRDSVNFSRSKMHLSKVMLLSAGHFINDTYNGFIAPLLPLIITKFGLSLTLAALITSTQSVSTSLSQPIFGHMSDKMKHPVFVYTGPLMTAIFLSSLGLCPTYGILLMAIVLAGIGTSAFHPQAAALAGSVSGSQQGLGMSLFATGGNAGFALGPIIILPIVATLGLRLSIIAILPGVIISYLLFRNRFKFKNDQYKTEHSSLSGLSFNRKIALMLLLLTVIIRAFMISGFITFTPIYLRQSGFSILISGIAITVFTMTGSIGSILGGGFSDKVGRKAVIMTSLIFAIPLLFLFLYTKGYFALIFLALSGFVIFSAVPVNIIMAQELFPHRISTVSSIIMGFGWGVGGLLVTPLGSIADGIGLQNALYLLNGLGIIGITAAILLPRTNPDRILQIKN